MTSLYSQLKPAIIGSLIIWIIGHIEFIFREIKPVWTGQHLQPIGDGFITEIITYRKIAQHFKHCVVASCFTNIFNIVGTDCFLRIRYPRIFRYNRAIKIFF